MVLIVGSTEPIKAQWSADGANAKLRIYRTRAGLVEYLQSDVATWSTTSHEFTMTLTTGVWSYDFVVPTSAEDYVLFFEATNPGYPMLVYSDHADVGVAPGAHTHPISEVTNLQTTLDGKAASSHSHAKADITDFAHTHPISEVTSLQTTLDGKVANAGATPSIQSGATASRPAAGTAGRLYWDTDTNRLYRDDGTAWDEVVPKTHTHVKADVTDFAHTHVKADVTDFSHTHPKSEISDFAHTHPFTEVTSTPTTLSGYGITDGVTNAGSTPSIQAGTTLGRPAAGTTGRLYWDTDTNRMYRDNGTAWVELVPKAHTHAKADITDFSHTHPKSEISDFAHTHPKSEISDFAHTHPKSEISDFAHTHAAADLPATTVYTDTAQTITGLKTFDRGASAAPFAVAQATAAKVANLDADKIDGAEGGGSGSITVEEFDGAPTVAGVTKLKVPNGSLKDDGSGVVRIFYEPTPQYAAFESYKKASGDASTSIATGGTGYVRDATRLVIQGKTVKDADRTGWTCTYNGVTYSEGTGTDDGYIVTGTTRVGKFGADFTDSDGVVKSRWFFGTADGTDTTGITAVGPGTDGTTYTFAFSSDGQAEISANITVDRTAPSAALAWNSTYGGASTSPMYRGEKGNWTPTYSDSVSGIASATYSYSNAAHWVGEPTTAGASGTATSDIRTTSSAPLTGTTDITLTVTDNAGNVGTATMSVHFTGLPAAIAPSLSITSTNESPYTVFKDDEVGTGSSYDDNTITGTLTLPSESPACRNTGTRNGYVYIGSGTLTVSGAIASLTTALSYSVSGTVSNQSSGLGKNVSPRHYDQYYRTTSGTAVGNFDYNANKTDDIDIEPSNVAAWGGLGAVRSETFPDADTARVISKTNAQIVGGYAEKTAAGGQIVVKIPLANNTSDQYGVKLTKTDDSVIDTAQGGTDADITIETNSAADGTGTWTSRAPGAVFTSTANLTHMQVRITWGTNGVPIGGIYVGHMGG